MGLGLTPDVKSEYFSKAGVVLSLVIFLGADRSLLSSNFGNVSIFNSIVVRKLDAISVLRFWCTISLHIVHLNSCGMGPLIELIQLSGIGAFKRHPLTQPLIL